MLKCKCRRKTSDEEGEQLPRSNMSHNNPTWGSVLVQRQAARSRPTSHHGYAALVSLYSCAYMLVVLCIVFPFLLSCFKGSAQVIGERGGDRSGGRCVKMSLISAARQKRAPWDWRTNLKFTDDLQKEAETWTTGYKSCGFPVRPAGGVMSPDRVEQNFELITTIYHWFFYWFHCQLKHDCVLISPAVSQSPWTPPKSGSLSVSSLLGPAGPGPRNKSDWSVSSRQPWRWSRKTVRINNKSGCHGFIENTGHAESVESFGRRLMICLWLISFTTAFF